ncbi:sugar transferase [Sulfurimonas sp. MAG313]|nr:sugar transferase [Sulfurimonas sp. MAG313]MDF1881431.1 sugar transferase [Sulfurimonas sp. MAG313]
MYKFFLKGVLDKILALVLLLVLSPILLLTSLAIYIKMGRPLFFRQNRPGKDEQIFSIYKFRSMSNETDEKGELLSDEERLRGLGQKIRSLSLDELPQLFNVLKGEMSFIGPRPLLIEYLPIYNEIQKKRHSVAPGISGWAQVNGRNAISWKEKFEYDVWYTENISFMLDMKIVIMTIQKVLMRKDISANDHVTAEKFNEHN